MFIKDLKVICWKFPPADRSRRRRGEMTSLYWSERTDPAYPAIQWHRFQVFILLPWGSLSFLQSISERRAQTSLTGSYVITILSGSILARRCVCL
ncbi:hypothetical protein DL95DRAFT_111052 [Leptodontidium sp. 2 PMI_412]|nr:hypothetical protein DL95DRAFT_111052 [Leptodontidium sp. 2 PMI_412]